MNIWQRFKQWLANGFDVIAMIRASLSSDPAVWEPYIQRFEAADRLQPPPTDVIVFTGSSSITFWSTLAQDMAPLPVINRGFGGSHLNDVVHYAPRLVVAYRPRAVVLFAGTNDIAGSKPKTAQEVFDGYRAFVDVVQAALPATPIYYISITPTPSRWKLWPIVQEANRLIGDYTQTDPQLHLIDLTDVILGSDGKPDRSLFRLDRLHPNPKGYAVWTAKIKPILLADLK
ncbi:MAG TPA: GDSL-type esterase/lipase family protein [Anaerolineae bacterium]|nr:GDSL-type esterase/lipase family protein [Anaerolineae bacterium]